MRPRVPVFSLILLGTLCTSLGFAKDIDRFLISIPDSRALFEYDVLNDTLTPFSGPMLYPFYGQYAPDNVFFVPDSDIDIVWRVLPDGTREMLTSEGFLGRPATLLVSATNQFLCVTNNESNNVVEVDLSDGSQRIVADNASGLFQGPGGMEFSRDQSILFVTNVQGDSIVAVDPSTGVVAPFADSQGVLDGPAALQMDGSGNMFATNFDNDIIALFDEQTGEARAFVQSPLLQQANDLKYSTEGALYTTVADIHALVRINALGEIEIVKQDASLGKWFGVSFDRDCEFCSGQSDRYGSGTPGTGGLVPRYGMIFSPCLGAEVAFELDFIPSATGYIAWSLSAAQVPAFGGEILIDFTAPHGLIPIQLGPTGSLDILFQVPDDPFYDGLTLYEQLLFLDPGAKGGVALSNGLEIRFGQ